MDTHEHDPLQDADPALLRALRDGAAPRLDDGAAERVADGAWSRANATRSSRHGGGFRRRRLGLAAAAALVTAVGLLAIPSGDAVAFEVEGEPARVQKGDRWGKPTHEVRVGDVIELPGGSILIGPTGPAVTATQTSVFHIAAADALRLTVELRSGDVKIEGPNVLVDAGEMRVLADDELVVRHAFHVSFSRVAASTHDTAVQVRAVRGSCTVTAMNQRVELVRDQVARLVRDLEGRTSGLARVHKWDEAAPLMLFAGGGVPIDAHTEVQGSLHVLIERDTGSSRTSPYMVYDVAREDVAEAVGAVNALVDDCLRLGRLPTSALHEPNVAAFAGPVAEYAFEKDGRRIGIVVDSKGRAALAEGDERSAFSSVDALRKSRPDIATLFGDRLPD